MGWSSEPALRSIWRRSRSSCWAWASAIAFVALFQIHNTESLADLTVLGRLAITSRVEASSRTRRCQPAEHGQVSQGLRVVDLKQRNEGDAEAPPPNMTNGIFSR